MKYFWFILFTLLAFSAVHAEFVTDSTAVSPVKIKEENIENYKKDKAFDYSIKHDKSNILADTWEWIKRQFLYALGKILNWIFGAKKGGEILQFFLKALPYLAAVFFVYLIFRFLIGVDLINLRQNTKKNLNKVYLSDEERIIKEENLQQLIAEAIRNKQYRKAVRYYYLNILKQLIDKDLIEWHNKKTNRDYVKEVSKTQLGSYFKNLTFIYDYVWYGNYQPGEKEFEEIEKDFRNFQI